MKEPVRVPTAWHSTRRQGGLLNIAFVAASAVFFYQLFLSFLWKPLGELRASTGQYEADSTQSDLHVSGESDWESVWDSIKPSEDLSFKDCYNGLQCARLELPLDYWNGTKTTEKMIMAISMVPAKVPVTDPRYGGAILINPGGPGGSGVQMATAAGRFLQTMVDSSDSPHPSAPEEPGAKYFSIIGFDPRGVGRSVPKADCFGSQPSRESWELRRLTDGILGSSNAAQGWHRSVSDALGRSCATVSEEGYDIMHYITTASVARDMLELTERFGEWREKEARKSLRSRPHASSLSIPEHVQYKPGDEKLSYWGFSYGTFLGNTFASMFPDRVGRVVLDGNVDTDDYIGGFWTNSMDDTEKVMDLFYDTCAAAGPDKCPLIEKPDASPIDVRSVVEEILQSTYHHPFTISSKRPEVVSWSELKAIIFMNLYNPVLGFPATAQILASIRRGDGTELLPLLKRFHSYSCTPSKPREGLTSYQGEAQPAIMCGDAVCQQYMDNATKLDEHWHELMEKSPTGGGIWGLIRITCSKWQVRPLYSFRGPFGGDTRTPVLFIGNTGDPVTPLSAAVKMAALFPGAGVLTQNSPGHCSVAAFSSCTQRHLRSYFHNATLPDPGTMCEADQHPFDYTAGGVASVRLAERLSAEEMVRLNAHQNVAHALHNERFGWNMFPRL